MTKRPFFLSPDARKQRDPLDTFKLPVDRSGTTSPRDYTAGDAFRAEYEQRWEPPETARTFAEYGIDAARCLCAGKNKPDVIIREDPMFGRRGYAREVLSDPAVPGGYLILVIAYTTRKDTFGRWVEPVKPKSEDRMYWKPTKVEFAGR
jgi:hypothetical protein